MKKTLLIAAAALAAGVISTQAQVYSQNIVGYVNQALPGGNALTCVTAPIGGITTNAESLFSSVSVGDNVYIWTGGGYAIYNYAGVDGAGPGLNWYDPDFNGVASPQIKPGQALFFQNAGAAKTNTMVGNVQLTNTVSLLGGNALNFVGSTPPIGGLIDSTNFNLPLQVGDNVYIWTGGGYAIYNYAGVDGAGAGLNWYDPDFNGVASPTVAVGQGFFYQNAGATRDWTNNVVVP